MAGGVGFGLAGVSQAETDEYHAAQTTKTLGEVAMQPFEARKKLAEAEHKELELAAERRFAEIGARRAAERTQRGPTQQLSVSAGGNSAGDLAAAQLYEYAQDAMDAGRPKLAGEIATKASQIRQHEASAGNSQATARLHELQGSIQAANLMSRYINPDTVRDQASFDQAWRNLKLQGPAPAYSEQLIRDIHREGMSAHEAAQAEHQKITERETTRMNSARIQDLIDRRPLVKAQTSLADARTARIARDHGRGGTGEPKAADLKVVTDMIRPELINITPEELRNEGRTIASAALDRVARNPALTYREVVKELYLEKKAGGDFGIYGLEKPKEVTGGKVREKPLALPVLPDGKINLKNVKASTKDREYWYNIPGKGALKAVMQNGRLMFTDGEDD